MLTIHAAGGRAMVAAAVRAAASAAEEFGVPRPQILAVTVLTSIDAAALDDTGVHRTPLEQVALLARLARSEGADGVVCSPEEVADVRQILGPQGTVVTPGIRPSWAAAGDQLRVATPGSAFASGATYIVVGRPVTDADDPSAAFERLVADD
jgi:orotidine-5'-phosphate decarboxylase